jgi:hypothetical protein
VGGNPVVDGNELRTADVRSLATEMRSAARELTRRASAANTG